MKKETWATWFSWLLRIFFGVALALAVVAYTYPDKLARGPAGPTGAQGEAGADGVGEKGEAGDRGKPGKDGDDGKTGKTGATGAKGNGFWGGK